MAFVVGFLFHLWRGFDEAHRGGEFAEFAQQGAHDQSGMGGAETVVGTVAKGDVRVRFAVEFDFLRGVEDSFIEVGGRPAE